MSSLSRAFTTRKAKMSLDMTDIHKSPQRSNSTREYRGPILRHKISAPIQLVHTTNMLSYNAPDLPHPALGGSSTTSASTKSDVDSESNSLAESTPPTSPDVSLPASACPSPEPNHLSSYFMAPEKPQTPAPKAVEPPAIPQRSPSHTKKNSYDAIARQRSISRLSKDSEHTLSSKGSFSFSRSVSTSTTASSISSVSSGHGLKPAAIVVPSPSPPMTFQQRMYAKEPHPFGHELAQVTELAEEYGAKSGSLMGGDSEIEYLREHGLLQFTADDYLSEIQGIASIFFEEAATHARTATPLWI